MNRLMQKQKHVPVLMHAVTHYDCGSNSVQNGTQHFPCINLELPFKSM